MTRRSFAQWFVAALSGASMGEAGVAPRLEQHQPSGATSAQPGLCTDQSSRVWINRTEIVGMVGNVSVCWDYPRMVDVTVFGGPHRSIVYGEPDCTVSLDISGLPVRKLRIPYGERVAIKIATDRGVVLKGTALVSEVRHEIGSTWHTDRLAMTLALFQPDA